MTKTKSFKREFTDAEAARLARLSSTNDFQNALNEIIDEMLKTGIGTPTIRSTSGGSQRVSAPSVNRGV